jgi:hypothetical protein
MSSLGFLSFREYLPPYHKQDKSQVIRSYDGTILSLPLRKYHDLERKLTASDNLTSLLNKSEKSADKTAGLGFRPPVPEPTGPNLPEKDFKSKGLDFKLRSC